MKSSILYDRILRARIIPLNNSDTSFSVDINSPSKSLKGVLLIFTKERSATKFTHNTEEFFNPKITKVWWPIVIIANLLINMIYFSGNEKYQDFFLKVFCIKIKQFKIKFKLRRKVKAKTVSI